MGVGDFQTRVVFQPIPLVDGVVLLVGRMTCVEFDEKASVLQCCGMGLQRAGNIDAHKRPFRDCGARNTVRYKKQTICTRQKPLGLVNGPMVGTCGAGGAMAGGRGSAGTAGSEWGRASSVREASSVAARAVARD